jgi:two-component system cell cycle response regulator
VSARILIVDDMSATATLLALKLEAEYYETRTAGDPYEALRLAGEWRPDLLLLDVMMPKMDGFEACRRLKADEQTRHIPVIMVTALDGAAERLRGLEAGADDFLTKPVDFDTLLARLKGLLRLKRLLDEWRARAQTIRGLGLGIEDSGEVPVRGSSALIVDDWEAGASKVRHGLALEGMVTYHARSEEEALEFCRTRPIDLAVISLSLASGDPLRLASRLRTTPATQDVPVLMIAEQDQRSAIVRGFDLGASDWVTRPLDENELRVRARNQLRRRIYQDHLRSDLDQVLTLAAIDPLTGLYNRRYLERYLDTVADPAPKHVAAMILDLDDFKSINDRFGHEAGDTALRAVAAILRDEMRAVDLVARLGGEEFVVILPETNEPEAVRAGERLRAAVEAVEFAPTPAGRCPLTVSIGIAVAADGWPPPGELLAVADRALYRAKAAGKNRIEMADGVSP